jgi:CheY-like chemotaxis protein
MAVEMTLTQENSAPLVLLVEDSADDAFFFQRALGRSGCECQFKHVCDGAAAITLLTEAISNEQQRPDVIFLDLKMPVVNGFEVLEWLRQQPLSTRMRVIVLSGSNQRADRDRARDLGAFDYMVKPVSSSAITETLRNLTSKVGIQE